MARSKLKRRARKEQEIVDLSGCLVTTIEPSNGASEDYRTLRTSLLYALVDSPPKVIVITSPGPSEGKSTTCANLGVALSQADKNTLIVDCDLRKPAQHLIFGLRNMKGLGSILVGSHNPRDVYQNPIGNLDLTVITTGPPPPNPAELLSSRRFAGFIDQVRPEFDYVLIDVPPVDLVSDPTIAATQGDGVLLILDAQNTGKGSVRQAMRSLESVGVNVLGTVMNNAKASRKGYYKYGNVY